MNSDMFDFVQKESVYVEKEIKKYIAQLVTEINEVAEKYAKQYQNLYDSVREQIVISKISSSGQGAFRGIYTPSIICPYLVTNYKKGRILNSKPASGKYFCYYFDKDERLLQVDYYAMNKLQTREYIVRNSSNVEYGLVYDKQQFLIMGNRTIFNDKREITEFFESKMPLIKSQNMFDYEKYYYDDKDQLEGADKVFNGIYPNAFRYFRYVVFKKNGKTTVMPVSDRIMTFGN
jgi:hypothetical protein